jgi:hypothetical protein
MQFRSATKTLEEKRLEACCLTCNIDETSVHDEIGESFVRDIRQAVVAHVEQLKSSTRSQRRVVREILQEITTQ